MARVIKTKYLGATNHDSSRIIASMKDTKEKVVVIYDTNYRDSENHLRAAKELAAIIGWKGDWSGGVLDEASYVWVKRDPEIQFQSKKKTLNPAV